VTNQAAGSFDMRTYNPDAQQPLVKISVFRRGFAFDAIPGNTSILNAVVRRRRGELR
jgi:hypothetical protein